jgi:uncharacterized protein
MTATKSGRTCGDCSLCCLLLDVPEVNKPKDGWCRHCRPGQGGCGIYNKRPDVCRNWTCLWLAGSMPDYWYPLRSKLVLDRHPGILRVFTHPEHPDQWRAEPYHSELKALARAGLTKTTEETFYLTVIIDREYGRILLPHSDVPYTPGVLHIEEILAIGRATFCRRRLDPALEEEFGRRFGEEVLIAQHYA